MSRTFTHDDQLAFARLSGDYNPIHLDEVVARRLMFGRTVLHGMQIVLSAMDQWLGHRGLPARLRTIRVDFRRPASAGQSIEFACQELRPDDARIEVTSDGIALLNIELQLGPFHQEGIAIPLPASPPTVAKERFPSELRGCEGRMPLWLDRDLAGQLFPNLVRLLPMAQLATLLATSRLVGMEAPGLHSIWRGFEFHDSGAGTSAELLYRPKRFDERFSLLDLQIESPGLCGTIRTGVRAQPSSQPAYAVTQSMVRQDEFRAHRALVIGGSRGLGEVATKLLAAGGAQVRFSYHQGADDANRIAGDITSAGGSVICFQYDVTSDPEGLRAELGDWPPTLLCYFATPFIFAGIQGRFSPELFRRFCDFYVTGFYRTLQAAGEVKRVLYPSSVAVDQPPANLLEYAAAKAAGENLCRSLAAAHPEMRFHCPRFARLATDQTATLLRVPAMDPLEPVLAAIREAVR